MPTYKCNQCDHEVEVDSDDVGLICKKSENHSNKKPLARMVNYE